jgi:diguanylate cyclase (GGDEF)-like protein
MAESDSTRLPMLGRIVSDLRRIGSGDLSYFGGPVLDEAVWGRIRAEQVGIILHYLPWIMLANACNALILVAAFWMSPERPWALAWAAAVFAYALFYGIRSARRRGVKPSFVSAHTVRRAVRNAFLLGSIWALLPSLFFAGAASGGQLIIICLCAGMLGGGGIAFASLPVAAIAFTGPIFVASAVAIARSGDPIHFLVALLMVVYTGVLLRGVFVHALKLTTRLVAQIEAEKEVRKDPLTHLPNRIAFQESLDGALARLGRTGERFALLYLDLDELKAVNDKLGHAAGDALLVQVAARLRTRKRDIDTLARLSGDEFALIAVGVDSADDALSFAERLVEAFDVPFDLDGTKVASTATIGIALAPENGTDSGSLLKNADTALYSAKLNAGGPVQMFQPHFDVRARERRALRNDLRAPLERDELHLVFQPLLDLAHDRLVGCEALLRWTHPTRGPIRPEEFMQVAEETHLIHVIGERVVREACRTAASWPADTKISVNLSAAQFRKANILAVIVSALTDARLAASRLEIEITESVLMAEDDFAFATLNTLRGLGVRIALDDFGTGHSSLSYLRRLPLDRIKIDRSFIGGLLTDHDCASIVRFVIGLARDLGMSVTAEGVETKEQLSCLRTMQCDEAQGYLIGAPKSPAEIAVLFDGRRAMPTAAAM